MRGIYITAGAVTVGILPFVEPEYAMPIAVGIPSILGVALLLGARGEARRSKGQDRPIDVRLQDALDHVKHSMQHASALMDELRREMDAQTATRDALIVQAEEHRRLAEIDQEQAEKIRAILIGESKAESRRQSRVQLMYFVAGLLLSIPIGVAINLFTS